MHIRVVIQFWVVGFATLPVLVQAQVKLPVVMTSARANRTMVAPNRPATLTETKKVAEPVAPASIDTTPTTAPAVAANINLLPLFGERSKTAEQIDYEIRFLSDCDQNFGSRDEASQFFAARAWEYVGESQLDTATHRFNLAYLLNDKNADAYWGLGVVCYQKNNLTDAIRMLKRGMAVSDTNAVLMTDLATVQLAQFQAQHDSLELEEAQTNLLKAIALKPDYPTAHLQLSLLHYLRADYGKAWEYLHHARTIDFSSLDLKYLDELMKKQPDPRGVFK